MYSGTPSIFHIWTRGNTGKVRSDDSSWWTSLSEQTQYQTPYHRCANLRLCSFWTPSPLRWRQYALPKPFTNLHNITSQHTYVVNMAGWTSTLAKILDYLTLNMEALRSSEMSETIISPYNIISQKTWIFINNVVCKISEKKNLDYLTFKREELSTSETSETIMIWQNVTPYQTNTVVWSPYNDGGRCAKKLTAQAKCVVLCEQQECSNLLSSGRWRRVIWYVDTKILKNPAASISHYESYYNILRNVVIVQFHQNVRKKKRPTVTWRVTMKSKTRRTR